MPLAYERETRARSFKANSGDCFCSYLIPQGFISGSRRKVAKAEELSWMISLCLILLLFCQFFLLLPPFLNSCLVVQLSDSIWCQLYQCKSCWSINPYAVNTEIYPSLSDHTMHFLPATCSSSTPIAQWFPSALQMLLWGPSSLYMFYIHIYIYMPSDSSALCMLSTSAYLWLPRGDALLT